MFGLHVIAVLPVAGYALASNLNPWQADRSSGLMRGRAFIKREPSAVNEDGGVFPSNCTETCQLHVDVLENCGISADTLPVSFKFASDDLPCVCTDDYFDTVLPCMQCAPEPFRSQGGLSSKEWIDSAMTTCYDSGHEVTCVDTPSFDEDDDEADIEDEGVGAGLSEGEETLEHSVDTFAETDTIKAASTTMSSASPGNTTKSAGSSRQPDDGLSPGSEKVPLKGQAHNENSTAIRVPAVSPSETVTSDADGMPLNVSCAYEAVRMNTASFTIIVGFLLGTSHLWQLALPFHQV